MKEQILQVIVAELLHVFDLNEEKDVIKYLQEVGINYYKTETSFEIGALSNLDFVKGAKQVFLNYKFCDNFGGNPWVNICQAYIDMEQDTEITLGKILDLRHNTGTLREKLKALPANNKEK